METTEKEESLAQYREHIVNLLEAGNSVIAANLSLNAVAQSLSIALTKADDVQDGIRELHDHDTEKLLAQATDIHRDLQQEITAETKPDSVIGGVYHLLVLVHVAWLLDDHATASKLIEIAVDQKERGYATPLWDQYMEATASFSQRQAFEPREPQKLRGLEPYWYQYVVLMSDVANGRDASATMERIAEGFARRNADKRLKDDSEEIEGTGLAPVNWDFRVESIRRAASALYDVSI